jgi:hypothetical protein
MASLFCNKYKYNSSFSCCVTRNDVLVPEFYQFYYLMVFLRSNLLWLDFIRVKLADTLDFKDSICESGLITEGFDSVADFKILLRSNTNLLYSPINSVASPLMMLLGNKSTFSFHKIKHRTDHVQLYISLLPFIVFTRTFYKKRLLFRYPSTGWSFEILHFALWRRRRQLS